MPVKYPWTWQHMFVPSVHHRPPFPMSARQRLYEIRKRCRKTEIPSVRLWAVNEKLLDYCDYCTTFIFDECEADIHGNDGCPLSHDRAVFRRQVEAKARFHRMSRKERLHERRKRSVRKRKAYHRTAKRAHTDKLRHKCLLRAAVLRLCETMKVC